MPVRLRAAGEPRWIDLPHGVRLKVRPVTSATVAAAQSAGRRKMMEFPEDVRADADYVTGLAFAITVSALARLSVVEWEGVLTEEGDPAPVSPDAVDMLMLQEDMAFAFWAASTATVHEVVAEGNG